jgi:HSP20 family protein
MNGSVRKDPWSLMPRLQDDINRLFGAVTQSDGSSSATATWVPAVDIREYADRFELFIDVPGVDAKKVDLTLDNGVLTVSGERVEEQAQGNEALLRYERTERPLGRFHRRFVLPDTADSSKVQAAGRDGVLKVTIAKQERALPRRIQIEG